jgi:hypothetical protein
MEGRRGDGEFPLIPTDPPKNFEKRSALLQGLAGQSPAAASRAPTSTGFDNGGRDIAR